MKKVLLATVLAIVPAVSSRAGVVITEVDPAGSGNTNYAADWFELTNTGTSAQDITGWKMDDNSNSFGSAVPIRNITGFTPITSIPAGATIVLFEGTTSGSTDPTLATNLETAWFGATAGVPNVPSGFLIGAYGGSGVGLSTGGDDVHVFDSTGVAQAGVSFGAAPAGGATFDNLAGINGTISTASVVGTNGAFTSADGREIGSPGSAVPEPASLSLLAGAALLATRRRAK